MFNAISILNNCKSSSVSLTDIYPNFSIKIESISKTLALVLPDLLMFKNSRIAAAVPVFAKF